MQKNVALMGGGVINAGDFLLEERTRSLIEHFIPGANVTLLNRVKKNYNHELNRLNEFDAIIFGGGPMYVPNIYPELMPFIKEENFEKLNTPVFFVGGGCWSRVYSDEMSESTKSFFRLGLEKGVPLGCRDIYTYRYLKHQGFDNILLTGCVAWYDMESVQQTSLKQHHGGQIRKICVSEPAAERNVVLLKELLIFLRNQFSGAEIILVNHRELKPSVNLLKEGILDKYHIKFQDISNSVKGFSVYDDCDLHVGFRVHAHIYNLSKRNYSILISEDIRGAGVNHTLGLENIEVVDPHTSYRAIYKNYGIYRRNESFLEANSISKRIADYIDYTEMVNYSNYKETFSRMKNYFNSMYKQFDLIKSAIE